jgi:TetR/AcrR family transcriptional repressor of nem operon
MSQRSNTADQVIAVTRNLIVAGGYNGFSYADIASLVGIRKASIHHHFPTKADLVRALVVGYRGELEAGLADIERAITDPADKLRAYAGYWEACIADGSAAICICALLASEVPVLPSEVAFEVRGHFRLLSSWLASVFERGQRDGRIAMASTPAQEAEGFMATVHGAMLSARAYGDPKMFGNILSPVLARLTGAKSSRTG